jgi:hypothetical protein
MLSAVMSEAEAERRYQVLLRELRGEFPGFRLLRKRDDRLQRAIDVALRAVTLGRMRAYLDGYQTTLGRSVYVTDDWPTLPAVHRWATLRHEAVHLRQFRRLGFVGMAILYLLVPLPVGLAYCRMRLEREAYEETLRALYEALGEAALRDNALRASIICQFTSAAYGWMWPFPRAVGRWYDAFVEDVIRGG